MKITELQREELVADLRESLEEAIASLSEMRGPDIDFREWKPKMLKVFEAIDRSHSLAIARLNQFTVIHIRERKK